MVTNNKLIRFSVFFAVLGLLSSCNLFQLVDNPGNDLQYLSKARACLDQLDFTCARENYAKLSSDFADEKLSEQIFVTLEEQGVGMGTFMRSIGAGASGGKGLTKMANITAPTANSTKRLSVFSAFSNVSEITQNELRGLVRFAVAYAIIGVTLGEIAGSDNVLQKNDIASSGSACVAAGSGGAAASANCNSQVSVIGTTFSFSDSDASSSSSKMGSSVPTLEIIDAALAEISTALGTSELGGSGKFASSGTLAQVFDAVAPGASTSAAATRVFIFSLVSNDVGD